MEQNAKPIGPSHDPARGILCLCLACANRPYPKLVYVDYPWLDGDYDLIDTRRRYELGE